MYVAYKLFWTELNDTGFPTISIFCLILFMFKLPISSNFQYTHSIKIKINDRQIVWLFS